MMIPASVLKAVARAASREKGRYAINGVNLSVPGIAPDGKPMQNGVSITATDGRMLLRGMGETETDEHVTPRIVALSGVAAALADPMSKWGAKNAVIHSNGALTYASQSVGADVPMAEEKDATFPDTSSIVPDKEAAVFSVTISAEILATLAAAAKDVQKDGPCIVFRFSADPVAPIRVEMGEYGNQIVGVVMPMSA